MKKGLVAMFLASIFMIGCGSSEKVEDKVPTTVQEAALDTEMKAPDYTKLKGRGQSETDQWDIPQYVNTEGYIVTEEWDYSYDGHLLNQVERLDTPWYVDTYELNNKNEYVATGTVAHKTPVKVVAQELSEKGRNFHSGYLTVQTLDTKEQYVINVKSYLTRPYWEYDVEESVKDGASIAEYNQVSGILPVDNNDNDYEIEDGTLVLVFERTSGSGTRAEYNQIRCYVYPQKEDGSYGYEWVYINSEDLTIVY